ncbi:acyl-coenzyme A oxidase-like protein isoform X1 [Danio aesculapii]|uniref:acyl-coenzyme A oxidase-like protein isoform X1 n=1 Tax=Danio aesculapii TaxID=1142201 RepID=UPI0024BF9005|nr:acyl-coenzyme A oxidase-like protein isoform X1 [Danio aesculapii]
MFLSSMDQMPSSSLARYLDGEFCEIKHAFRDAISKSELFQSSCYERTLDQNRDLTADRLSHILRLPVMKEHLKNQLKEKQKGFINKSMSITEVVCAADMNTGVKLGVVCGLYGGAVNNLGSPEQKIKFYLPVSELQFTGMFAMTERGHGSNVRGIITEARYDQATQEFIIHTPSEDAHKMYIGNAMKGNFAAVFAQLIINGESQGPHCFVVPIRDENGIMWPGVTVSDMKHKEGLHGVDNGILIFDNVRIPRENLLGKFGSVSADGLYSSPALRGNRFNAMLAALTPTRLGLTVQAMAAMKLGLIIAVRYSHSRRQFGPKDQEEVKIMEHQTQNLRLMPHLSAALALTFTSRYAADLMDDALCKGEDLQSNRALQALVAGLKAYSTWANVACLQDCRECTGGMGFMMENRIPSLKCDSDVFVTFEGDNMVMLQVVVRELLTQYTKQMGNNLVMGLIRNLTSSASDSLRTSFLGFSVDKVGDLMFLLKAVRYRERVLQRSLASRLYTKVDKNKEEFFMAWNSCLHHVTTLALAHIHRVTLEQFALAVRDCQIKEDRALLSKFCLLHGTSLVYQERAWYLEHKYLSPATSRQIRSQLLELCRSVKDDALKVVDDFNIPSCCIQAPIAGIANPRAEWAFYPKPEYPSSTQPLSKL